MSRTGTAKSQMRNPHHRVSVVVFSLCLSVFLSGFPNLVRAQQPQPSSGTAHGIQLYQQGDLDGAIKLLKETVKHQPDDAIAWHYLGLSLVLKEDWKGARKAFEKAVTLRPDFAPARANLANTLLFTKGVKDAEKQASQALSLEPANAEAHYVLGTIQLVQGSCAEALAQADAALLSHPDFPSAYLLRSQSLICEAANLKPYRFDGAVFKTSVSSGEISKEEKALRAKNFALRFKEAAANLEMFLKLAPGVADAQVWREQIQTLRVYAEPADKADTDRTLFNGSEVTTRARVLKKPEPSYTSAARNAQVEGTVVLRAIFAADGQVKNILVLSRLPYGLTQQAIEVARKIKFDPATRDGRPVSTFVQLEYNFNLY